MFTGIVEEVGTVVAASATSLTIAARTVLEDLRLGDSIACDGTCLTVTRFGGGRFTVGLQPETLRRTTLGQARPGQRINLERALPANGRLGGHFVQGHVDGTGRLVSIRPEGEAMVVRVSAPDRLLRYVVEKGFIAVDGVSLTVTEVDGDTFAVSLVAYTQAHIALLDKRPGDPVNLEVDILAKYVEKLIGAGRGAGDRGSAGRDSGSEDGGTGEDSRPAGLTEEFLARHGFA